MAGYAARIVTKRLSARAHAAVLKRMAERDEHALLVEALSQSIERVIEQDCKVSLDKQNWELDPQEGVIRRVVILSKESTDVQPAA